ncbi:outer membrane beta-barrel protein [Salinimicrobium sp. WS361]|uniref:outer membrane beta-barrel protein n=1 Tax=Salinimicrobium sp. WS361 TaxID=3425123 RepID=UPI003D6F0CA2
MDNMNKLTILIFILLPFIGKSQSLENWQVGINASTFYFDRLNSSALNLEDQQDIPNGYAVGITMEKNWNSNWGFKTGFEYSHQFFKEIANAFGPRYPMESEFNYLKIPLTVQYSLPINKEQDLFLVLNQGIKISFLTDYMSVITGNDFELIYAPGKNINYKNGELRYSNDVDWHFEKITFGLIGSIGLKKFLSSNFSASAGVGYGFDLTNADDRPLFTADPEIQPEWEAKATHNLRVGIEIGVQYHFSSASAN